MSKQSNAIAAAATVLVLRTCAADMSAYNDFKWPEKGHVSAPDWNPRAECGNGLHGLLWGQGDGSHLCFEDGAKWLVVRVAADSIVDLDGKVKFPEGEVVYCGTQDEATQLIAAEHTGPIAGLTMSVSARNAIAIAGYRGTASAGYRGTASAGNYGTASAGNYGTASAGEGGTASAGEGGTASAGNYGTASAGNYGTASAGNYGTASAGEGGTASAGYRGTASAGNYGTASAGYRGTASAGNYGTASAGEGGTASAGEGGTASAGNYGTASAGEGGVIELSEWDGKRTRRFIGYVGENDIKPDTKYRLKNGAFVAVEEVA